MAAQDTKTCLKCIQTPSMSGWCSDRYLRELEGNPCKWCGKQPGRAEFGGKVCSLKCSVAREKYHHLEEKITLKRRHWLALKKRVKVLEGLVASLNIPVPKST